MFNGIREKIQYYVEWNKPAFIVFLIMAGVGVTLTTAHILAAGGIIDTGHLAQACKTRC